MRQLWSIALFCVLSTSFASGQQTNASSPATQANVQSSSVRVFAVGPEVTAPKLLPASVPLIPIEDCMIKLDGEVTLSFLVETNGHPRNLSFLHPLGSDLDKFALRILAADRFSPGTHDGVPVVVEQSVDLSLQTCLVQTEDSGGSKTYRLRLRSQPVQEFKAAKPPQEAVLTRGKTGWKGRTKGVPGITEPFPLLVPEALYTPEARKAGINGNCLISLIVDANGMPQNLRVERTLNPGLDQNALEAVSKYRFRPAMKSGEPVSVHIFVEIHFRLY